MNITAFSISHSRVTICLMLFVIISGVILYSSYPKKEDPSITVREAIVTAQFTGMSTPRVEYLITRPLEEKIREIAEVDVIASESKLGNSIIHVTVKDEVKDLDSIWQTLRNKVNDAKGQLPTGTSGPFVNDEFGLTSLATVAITGDGFSPTEIIDVAKDIRDDLYSLNGIERVEIYGEQKERINIEFKSTKIAELGISPTTIQHILQKQNVLLTGGTLYISSRSFSVEPSGELRDIDEISSLFMPIPNSQQSVELQDIATITREYVSPIEKPVLFNNIPSVVLSISAFDATDAIKFGEQLVDKINSWESRLPIGYSLHFATYQPDLIEDAVNGAVINLGQTIAIVLAVVILFLGVRTGLIVGSFVPLVMLFGMLGMSVFEIELQRISIASMVIALGMLVDNGIVVAQDMQTRLEQGVERKQAALDTGKALSIPLLTSTLTTILAFMPLMLMEGAAGEYTGSLSYVTAILMLGSWLLALLVVPLVSLKFMKVKSDSVTTPSEKLNSGLYKYYELFLTRILKQRTLFLSIVILSLVISVFGFSKIPKEFFPKGDRAQFLVYMDSPSGTASDKVLSDIQAVNTWLLSKSENPEVKNVINYIGEGGPRFYSALAPVDPDSHRSFTVVDVEDSSQVKQLVNRTHNYLLNNFPDSTAQVKTMWLGPAESGLYEVRFSGPDNDVLVAIAEKFMLKLYDIKGIVDVKHDWENPTFQFDIVIDQSKARRAGVSSEDVANTLATFLDGSYISDFREQDNVIPIVMQGNDLERNQTSSLWNLKVFSESNQSGVSLEQIADIRGTSQYSRIKRRNQQRTITVQAKHNDFKAANIHSEISESLSDLMKEAPESYSYELAGELEGSSSAQTKLATWMPIAFIIIAILLIWQFNSFRRAGVILCTIPLILIGSVVGLLVMDAVFGFMTILGLLALTGIIINNGIVMIDRIEEARTDGLAIFDAIVFSAKARLQPILLSAGTTVLGLIPLIISKDPLFYGMASMMAFALAIGTILTLGVIPVLYSIFMRTKT